MNNIESPIEIILQHVILLGLLKNAWSVYVIFSKNSVFDKSDTIVTSKVTSTAT